MSNPEENVEPQLEETVETTEEVKPEDVLDPTIPVITMQQMSHMLTSQTFEIIGAIGQSLKQRYDQLTTGIPPKAKKDPKLKGYIAALNDIATGLKQYQDAITERAIADGVLTREDVPDLPAEYQDTSEEDVEVVE
jgi:hypothetical protein